MSYKNNQKNKNNKRQKKKSREKTHRKTRICSMQHPSSTKIQSEKERSASLNTFYEIFHPLKCVSSKRNVFGDAVHIRHIISGISETRG